MRCLVTGVAGFVGSTLAERLLEDGHEVVGVDVFTDYYPRPRKESNLARARQYGAFRLHELDLATADLAPLLDGVTWVFHQAAQAGVRASWGGMFESYLHHNVLSTQRLLEAAKGTGVKKVVYASSSSVYGETEDLPMRETGLTRPFSPYGVTKLAAEHLCELYRHNFGVPTASLRYFTVYGPRQRPDMAFHKLIEALLRGESFPLHGDGEQTRDFTFVQDVVEANLLAAAGGEGVFNVGGGSTVTMNQVVATLEELTGKKARLERGGAQKGDVRNTQADASRARTMLGFTPKVPLRAGLAAQVRWHEGLR